MGSTGGAAIVHHHELTYALALPPGKEWVSREHWICRAHHVIRLANDLTHGVIDFIRFLNRIGDNRIERRFGCWRRMSRTAWRPVRLPMRWRCRRTRCRRTSRCWFGPG